MKRIEIIKKLLKEGFTEKTLSTMGDKEIKSLANIVLEQGGFNDAGEPLMTHQQYNDYSEPSDDEYEDNQNRHDEDDFDVGREFIDELKNNNLFVETFDGTEYFIRCRGNEDLAIYFKDEDIIIYDTLLESPENKEGEERFNSYIDAINYILKNKDRLLSFDESVKERDKEYRIEAQDRYNNRMEMGNLGENTMKRTDIIEKLLKEGFTEKTLSRMSDKNISTLSKTILGEQELKGSVVMSKDKARSNPTDIKTVTDKGINVELREKKLINKKSINKKSKEKDVDENIHNNITMGGILNSKGTAGYNPDTKKQDDDYAKSVRNKSNSKEEKKEIEEWVLNLAENNFTQFTSKKDIMSIINKNIQEASHNGIPEFMTYDSIKSAGEQPEPSQPGVEPETIPDTPTRPEKTPRKTPYTPGPGPDHKPKAFSNGGNPQTEPGPGAPEPETIPDTPTRPEKTPRKTPYTPGPGPDHKPKAFKNKF